MKFISDMCTCFSITPADVPSQVLWKQEIVSYTNRVHRVFAVPVECDKKAVDRINKMHGKDILDPSHPKTTRVRRILNHIIHGGINRLLLTNRPCDHDDHHHHHSSLKDLGPVPHRSRRKAAASSSQPHTSTMHLKQLSWEVFIVRNKGVRAYAMCGGKIVIYTGLLDSFDTDAEIATVLGHEIAHEVARHVLELPGFVESVFPFLGKLLPFSRRREIEADHIGIMLLAATGYDPRVAPGVFQKLGKINGDSPWEDYIGSHPSGKTRSRLLSQGKVMNKALELYHTQVCTRECPQ